MNNYSINKYVMLFFFNIIFISCDKKKNIYQNSEINHISEIPKSITGTYIGQISCDDCDFVELTLYGNSSYALKIQLFAEEDKEPIINEKGNYSYDKNNSILILDKYGFRFRISGNKLYYLDKSNKYYQEEFLIKE